jgi:hypothetical protein
MELKKEFLKDVEEAFHFWCSKQESVPRDLTLERWVTSILQKPVYEMIGAKRTENG